MDIALGQPFQIPLFGREPPKEAATAPLLVDKGYRVRRSRRSKRLSLQVHPSGRVEVLAPVRSSDTSIARFVKANQEWIESTRAAFRERFGVKSLALPKAINLPAIDRYCTVRYVKDIGDQVRVRGSTQLVLSGAIDDEDACRAALKRWLSRLAKREFSSRMRSLATLTGIEFSQVQVRLQRTCWGSRSSSGTISLNYSLAFLQPEQLNYILVHELCHARHMNHSRAFWALVEKYVPEYRNLDRSMDKAWADLPGWLDIY